MITRKSTKSKIVDIDNELIITFFSQPEHEWILRNKYYKRSFKLLWSSIPASRRAYFKKHAVLFLPSNGMLSCALSQLAGFHTILVFTDLMKILESSSFERGLAVLAHELGHLYHQHSYRDIAPLDAQFEADLFAAELGLKGPLIDILSEFEGTDNDERIKRLRSLS